VILELLWGLQYVCASFRCPCSALNKHASSGLVQIFYLVPLRMLALRQNKDALAALRLCKLHQSLCTANKRASSGLIQIFYLLPYRWQRSVITKMPRLIPSIYASSSFSVVVLLRPISPTGFYTCSLKPLRL
jgi:hypothetical protein